MIKKKKNFAAKQLSESTRGSELGGVYFFTYSLRTGRLVVFSERGVNDQGRHGATPHAVCSQKK